MTEQTQGTTNRSAPMRGIDATILALKASGGYKYRAMIALSGLELDRFVEGAEAMLRQPPPSYHARWEEYEGKCREVLEAKPE